MDATSPANFCVVSKIYATQFQLWELVPSDVDFEDIFFTSDSVNKSLKGKWAALACHETGSLVVQVLIFIRRLLDGVLPNSCRDKLSMLSRIWKTPLKMELLMSCLIKDRPFLARWLRVSGDHIASNTVSSLFPLWSNSSSSID